MAEALATQHTICLRSSRLPVAFLRIMPIIFVRVQPDSISEIAWLLMRLHQTPVDIVVLAIQIGPVPSETAGVMKSLFLFLHTSAALHCEILTETRKPNQMLPYD